MTKSVGPSASSRRGSRSRSLAGVALGLGGAAALSRLIESLLFGVTALDPGTYVLAALVLVATAAVAAYLPARRGAGGSDGGVAGGVKSGGTPKDESDALVP